MSHSAKTFRTGRRALPAAIATAALSALCMAGGAAHAQATTTSLGTYVLCRTTAAGQGCQEMSFTSAARFDGAGVRNGTTGTLTLRNLQGSTYVAPNGQSFATGAGASVLTSLTLYTQGCLPGQPCQSPDFFDGVPFGSNQSGASATSTSGPVAGTAPAWNWGASKPLAGDNPNTLRFDAPTRFISNFSNVQILGIGGCASGGGQYAGQFRDVVQEARTCNAQGFSGALQYGFSTSFIFDPTYFISMRIDWAQQTVPGSGDYAPYFCAASGNRAGDAMVSASGGCSVFSSAIAAVPEPTTQALFGAGLLLALGVASRRRRGAVLAWPRPGTALQEHANDPCRRRPSR